MPFGIRWKHLEEFFNQFALTSMSAEHAVRKGLAIFAELRWAGSNNDPCCLAFMLLCNQSPPLEGQVDLVTFSSEMEQGKK